MSGYSSKELRKAARDLRKEAPASSDPVVTMETALSKSALAKVVLAVRLAAPAEVHEISQSSRLAHDLGLGRFGRLKLVIQLEEMFDIELPDEALNRFVTVADIVAYLSRRYFRDAEFTGLTVAAVDGISCRR